MSACPFHRGHPHAQPAPQTPLAQLLKERTQQDHDAAEAHPFQARFAAGGISPAEYATFLAQVLTLHRWYDAALAASTHPAVRALANETHARAGLIERDLADLREGFGVEPPRPAAASPGARRCVEELAHMVAHEPAALLGVLYVLEGATNGNKIIVKSLRERLTLPAGRASRYLDPHGPEQRVRWVALKEGLNRTVLTPHEEGAAVEAARATFAFFARMGDEVAVGV